MKIMNGKDHITRRDKGNEGDKKKKKVFRKNEDMEGYFTLTGKLFTGSRLLLNFRMIFYGTKPLTWINARAVYQRIG